MSRRGSSFAPVRINPNAYSQRGFTYTPTTVIRIGELASQLFLRPNDGHYYFGDYYSDSYARTGFYPPHTFHSNRRGHDPIFSHQRWQHRQDNDWKRRVQEPFVYHREHYEARPPRTYSALRELLGVTGVGRSEQDSQRMLAQLFDEYRTHQDNAHPAKIFPLQSLNEEERREFGKRSQDINWFRD